jgi:hypothetical protein
MFLKAADKKDKKTGKIYRYYKLCESYRIGDKVRHRTIHVLGKLEEIENENERKILADRIEQLLTGSMEIFPSQVPGHVEKLAGRLYAQIREKGLLEDAGLLPEWEKDEHAAQDLQMVDLSTIELEDVREIGCEWLCKQALEEIQLGGFLSRQGWDKTQVDTALMHIISRAAFPASEHKTALWINENSSVSELFHVRPESINRFHLYKTSKLLYKHRESIEKYLSLRTNEIFDLQDRIILYDLTNTYFEGRKESSRLARFGRSKEKRSDAKIVALALVVNVEGFVKYSHIYEGNIADCKTLGETLSGLSARTSDSGRKALVVIDAGITTEDNLEMIRGLGHDYVCVSRSRLTDYQVPEEDMVHIEDNRHNSIDIGWVSSDESQDRFLYVHSQMKEVKETSMNDHFCQRYEEELGNLSRQLQKSTGKKNHYGTVMERIGRIKERYPAAIKHYKVDIKVKDGRIRNVTWERKPLTAPSGEGVYFIRTSLKQAEEKLVWDIYNTIRGVESTFRVLKTDLHLRPVFHRKDDHMMAHLYLGILVYMVVHTIRFRLSKRGIHHDWQNIRRIMNTQKAGTITVNDNQGKKIHIRVCSKPSAGVREIYTAMGYKPMPFHRRRFVFPEFRN